MALTEATNPLDQLEAQLLSLPENDRLHLAHFLWESLPPEYEEQEEFSPEYVAELDRRSAEIAAGTAVMIPMEAAMQHIDEIIRRG
jgi:putative addiction module component (TIGR02574 family)